jgi:HEAT repeat protein
MDTDTDDFNVPDLGPLLLRLSSGGATLSASEVAAFSELTRSRAAEVERAWPKLAEDSRTKLLASASELAEDDPLLDFVPLAHIACSDSVDSIRALAASMLWESDTPLAAKDLLALLEDAADEVRAAAAASLIHFVALDAEGRVRSEIGGRVLNGLRRHAEDPGESPVVRARSIESLGARDDEWVSELVTDAYNDEDRELRLASIRAMGHTVNHDWSEYVLEALTSDDPEFRFAAALAAGEIAADLFTDTVAALVEDEDAEVVFAAIHSLGEIGGTGAIRYLQSFAEHAGEQFDEAIADALSVATFFRMDLDDEL